MPRLTEVQESFARTGCFVIQRLAPARDGALAFSNSAVRLRLALAIGRQLIAVCRRNGNARSTGLEGRPARGNPGVTPPPRSKCYRGRSRSLRSQDRKSVV